MVDRSSESRLPAIESSTKNASSGLPLYPQGPYAAPLLPADTKALFGQFLKILGKQRWKLTLFMAMAIALALVLQFASPRLYSASVLLQLDRHSAPGAVGQEASQVSTINDMDVIIDTDMEVAQSDPVIRPVADKYHLVDNQMPSSIWARWFGINADAEAIRRAKTAPIKLTGLRVTRPANTYLIRITYRAWKNPQLAANVANGIAESLVRQVHESLDQSYDDLSGAMRRDMEQLRSKMDESSKKLTQYEKELNMVDPEQRSTVLTSRLTQLLAEYTAAQADRLHKEATLDGIMKFHTLAATQATEADRQRQTLLDEALEHLSTARQQFVAARSYYGENHPEYRKAKQQLDEAESQVEKMRVASNDKTEAEYRQALGRELLLKRQFEETKADVDNLKAHALAYSQLKSEAENDRRMYMELESRIRETDVNRQFRDATIQLVAPALPPAKAIFPKLTVNLPIAFVLALVLGVLGAIAADTLDTTFSDPAEVSARMRLEVMATLPDVQGLRARGHTEINLLPALYSRSAEMLARYEQAIRVLRNVIGRAGMNQPIRTLLITSGAPSEGKSTTAAHLAQACAQGGKKVLLIDADLRRSSLHRKFEITKKIGLANVLEHRLSPVEVIVEVDVPGLFVMPAGTPMLNAADLISLGFADVLNKVRSNFDLVIVDTPPMLGLSETEELATMVDGVLVIAKADVTSAKELAETLAVLSRSGANVLGVVMNQVKFSRLKGFGHYYQQHRQDQA
ncbi:MAG: polysaccharide biosynthesis tyrosine autokinase [Bryobacteraceae bacterium]